MIFNQAISFFRSRAADKRLARQLYVLCVAQGRKGELYRAFALEDNVQMRFEFITAHLWLVMRVLRQSHRRFVSKRLAALFFSEMDASLREAGEGDLGVPRKMKRLAQAFYGRLAAYDRAQQAGKLAEALERNFPANKRHNKMLESYFLSQIEHVSQVNFSITPSKQGETLSLFSQNPPTIC